MEGFFARRDRALGLNNGRRGKPCSDPACPTLCEALQGRWDDAQGVWLGPAYKLSVWMEGTLVKVCLGAGDGFPKWFWSFTGLEAALEQVEQALLGGKGDWVEPKVSK
jgi:hypothetical protein